MESSSYLELMSITSILPLFHVQDGLINAFKFCNMSLDITGNRVMILGNGAASSCLFSSPGGNPKLFSSSLTIRKNKLAVYPVSLRVKFLQGLILTLLSDEEKRLLALTPRANVTNFSPRL